MDQVELSRVVPTVELAAVHKSYGNTEALSGIDMRIDPGEVVAILGPNGAGKTTAVSLMLGLRGTTSGDVRLFGLPPNDRRARARCGAMLQESGVPAMLTVRELVDLFRSYYPAPLATDVALDLAGLGDRGRVRVSNLSGGQRQRLYFALAVCGDPDALFLDEPTVAMDVASRRAFVSTISGFAARGKTIVLTTHNMEEADELAQRVIVIDRGRVVADDTPARIKARVPGKRVTFSSEHPLAPDDMAVPDMRGLRIDGSQVRFFSNHPEEVLAALFARGVRLFDLEVVGADLAEAFLSLTSEGRVLQ